jgi:urease accessory protein
MSELSIGDAPLMRLLQLVSPAFPIGAFAYSHGLESAVELGFVRDAESAAGFIEGLLHQAFRTWEIPIFFRIHRAFMARDPRAVRSWNDLLWASRSSEELAEESRQLGLALARIATHLDVPGASEWWTDPKVTYETVFALACARWDVSADVGALAYVFGLCEMLVGAATRLIPLGQTDAQRILARLGVAAGPAAEHGAALDDDDLGSFAPAHAIASALHETQYTRLFRS